MRRAVLLGRGVAKRELGGVGGTSAWPIRLLSLKTSPQGAFTADAFERIPRPTADCGVSGGVAGSFSAQRRFRSEQEAQGEMVVGDEFRRPMVTTLGFVGL